MASQPGLPDLPSGSQPPTPPPALTGDTVDPSSSSGPAQWGLYQNGQPVITADSVATFGFKGTSEISTYPVEQGAFQSYNKVQLPNAGMIRYSQGGSLSDRQDFLNSCEVAKQSLDLYDLVTPEVTYSLMNVLNYDYTRTNVNGVGLIKVDMQLEEVVVTGTATFANTTASGQNGQTAITNAQNPAANDPQNNGQQQPQTPTSAQSQTLSQGAPFYNGVVTPPPFGS